MLPSHRGHEAGACRLLAYPSGQVQNAREERAQSLIGVARDGFSRAKLE
jgi:hypothetical protein